MHPEKLAQLVVEGIKLGIAPLGKQIAELKGENAALEAKLARLQTQLAEIQRDYLAHVQKGFATPQRGDARH